MRGLTRSQSSAGVSAGDRITGRLRLALIVICVTQLMMTVDGTVVTVALPTIQRGLHMSTVDLVWVTTAYTLTFGGLLLFGGRIGDLFGRRRLFMIGIGLFTVASLLGGFAIDDTSLIITRGVQGIGAAIASPTALSLVVTNFPEGRLRNKAMGAYAAMSSVGGATAQIAGGLLVDLVSWRWIFFINVPFGLLIMFLAPRAIDPGERHRGRLDVFGAFAITAGMVLLVYGLTKASEGWGSAAVVRSLAVGVGLVIAFVIWEARTPHALLPLRIFRNRSRAGAYSVGFFLGTGSISAFFFVTLYLQDVLGFNALQTGLSFLPIAAIVIVATQVSSRLVNHLPRHVIMASGTFLVVVGLFWLSRMDADSSFMDILLPELVMWYGNGTTMVPLVLTALYKVDKADAGVASAVQGTVQRMGGSAGLGILATVSVMVTNHGLAHPAVGESAARAHDVALAHGYGLAIFFGACIALLALVLIVVVLGTGRGRMEGLEALAEARRHNAPAPAGGDGTGGDATGPVREAVGTDLPTGARRGDEAGS